MKVNPILLETSLRHYVSSSASNGPREYRKSISYPLLKIKNVNFGLVGFKRKNDSRSFPVLIKDT